MTEIFMNHFDLLDFVDKSKELGVNENLAKYQARKFEQVINIAVATTRSEIEELATKQDIKNLELDIKATEQNLELKIKDLDIRMQQLNTRTIVWIAGLLFTNGLIQHFFK